MTAYLIGALVGAMGGSLAAGGVVSRQFWLFCLGTFICGLYGSFVQSYRFAAADTASPGFRPRAISWVMLGGLAAGIIGPQSVYWTRDLTPSAPFAASFLAQGALALLAICIVSQLRAPPVKTVRSDLGRGKTGELQGAVIISKDDIEDVMTRRMSAAQKTVVFCGSIKGSEPVVEKLRAAGLKDVYDVDGGFAALSEAGVPVMERKVPQG